MACFNFSHERQQNCNEESDWLTGRVWQPIRAINLCLCVYMRCVWVVYPAAAAATTATDCIESRSTSGIHRGAIEIMNKLLLVAAAEIYAHITHNAFNESDHYSAIIRVVVWHCNSFSICNRLILIFFSNLRCIRIDKSYYNVAVAYIVSLIQSM